MKYSFLLLLFLPLLSCYKPPAPAVTISTDIPYGYYIKQPLNLDIYTPAAATPNNKLPLMVMVHGGSFLTGDKNALASLCYDLAEKGMIVANINYRLGWKQDDTLSLNEAAYRAIQDLNASLRYLTAHANDYYIDTSRIFTGGASAGAVAALNSAYLTDSYAKMRFRQEYSELGSLYSADNNFTNTYTIKGICSMWGGIFDANIITAANALPTIFYHGSADTVIPANKGTYLQCPNYQTLYGSIYLYNKLTRLGVPAVAHIYQGEGHAPPEYADNPAFIAATTYCFLQSLRSNTPEVGRYRQMEDNCLH